MSFGCLSVGTLDNAQLRRLMAVVMMPPRVNDPEHCPKSVVDQLAVVKKPVVDSH